MHPLAPSLRELNETELHEKYNTLISRFLQAQNNPGLANQLQLLLNDYKQEIDRRNQEHQAALMEKLERNKNKTKKSSNGF